MRIRIVETGQYPVYDFTDLTFYQEISVDSRKVKRWKKAIEQFNKVQNEMKKVFERKLVGGFMTQHLDRPKCHGTYFSFLELIFYRCLLDGKVVKIEDGYIELERCPICSRPVDAETARIRSLELSNGYVLNMEQFQ